jgi:hypothetical protein
MSSASRLLLCFVTLGGLAAGVLVLDPSWLGAVGVDVCSWPEAQKELEQALNRREELDRRGDVMYKRLRGKDEATAALVEGRATLKETIARFQELDEQTQEAGMVTIASAQGAERDRRYCERVLSWAEGQFLTNDRAKEAAVRTRLEAEARELLTGP